MKINNFYKLVVSLIFPLLVGFLSGFLTSSAVNGWYLGIEKPFLNPPSYVFGPVWTVLYLMMGFSLYVAWTKAIHFSFIRKPGVFFSIQLTLNFLWSILFFGMQNPELALVNIVFLWLSILATIISFYKISKTAGYLLVPYLVWVSFATYLNTAIVLIN